MTPDAFLKRIVADPSQCWLWSLSTKRNGYGQVAYGGQTRLAHRWSYELLVGPIPEGLQLDHLCRVRSCVNPAHLEPVTVHENTRRSPYHAQRVAASLTKTHCRYGHALVGRNLLIEKHYRRCRECHNRNEARRKQRLREAAS